MRDVIVIGGGHNGLVAAAYLAAAGVKVTVLERRAQVGGSAATEEFHPGFRNSVAAYAGLAPEPYDHPRPRPRAPRASHRRASVVELPAPARRALSQGRARAHERGDRQILRPRRRAARRLRGAARAPDRGPARARAQNPAQSGDRTGPRRRSHEPPRNRQSRQTACVRSGSKGSAISSSSSPVRPAMSSTNGSRAIRSRRSSASTGSWEPMPAPMPREPATCSCITAGAR